MYTIDIDFEVYKALTIRRKTEDMTENDVIRELLGLNAIHNTKAKKIESEEIAWGWKGVSLPQRTELRAEYGGRIYFATVENGALVFNGKQYKSPSAAAEAITGNSVNGWKFWECKMPGKNGWVRLTELRNK